MLSSSDAVWTLCSVELFKAPHTELAENQNHMFDMAPTYQAISIQAYVVYVHYDQVLFKLSPETIEALVDSHREFLSTDTGGKIEAQAENWHQAFIQATNKFIHTADLQVLKKLKKNGAGILPHRQGSQVKAAITTLYRGVL